MSSSSRRNGQCGTLRRAPRRSGRRLQAREDRWARHRVLNRFGKRIPACPDCILLASRDRRGAASATRPGRRGLSTRSWRIVTTRHTIVADDQRFLLDAHGRRPGTTSSVEQPSPKSGNSVRYTRRTAPARRRPDSPSRRPRAARRVQHEPAIREHHAHERHDDGSSSRRRLADDCAYPDHRRGLHVGVHRPPAPHQGDQPRRCRAPEPRRQVVPAQQHQSGEHDRGDQPGTPPRPPTAGGPPRPRPAAGGPASARGTAPRRTSRC